MHHLFALLCFSAIIGFCGVSTTLRAADKKVKEKAGADAVEGKVSVDKVDLEKYTSIKIKNDKGETFNITIDDKGKDVAKQYEGIRVYLSGTIETVNGEKWLTVTKIGQGKTRKKK